MVLVACVVVGGAAVVVTATVVEVVDDVDVDVDEAADVGGVAVDVVDPALSSPPPQAPNSIASAMSSATGRFRIMTIPLGCPIVDDLGSVASARRQPLSGYGAEQPLTPR